MICRNVGSNFNFYHFDQQGNTLFLTGGTGLVTDTYVYDAWGNMVSQTGSTLQPFKYVGKYGYYAHYQDDNVMPYPVVTGSSSSGIPGNTALSFIQTGVRTYFPRLGRYMQVDPARDGINWLQYTDNNPVNAIDPTGKEGIGSGIGGLGISFYDILGLSVSVQYVKCRNKQGCVQEGILLTACAGAGIGGAVNVTFVDFQLSCDKINDLGGWGWNFTLAQIIGVSISGGFWNISSITVPPMAIWLGTEISLSACYTWVVWSRSIGT